ncbi:MAG: hypothetical protein U0361_18945 [Nitrospiraceae bacterium]
MRLRTWSIATCLLIVLTGHSSASAATDNRPFWTEQAVFHFADDVFFTGRASCAPNVEEGRQRAYFTAVQEIKNFTRAAEVEGFQIDTQMVFEDMHPTDCANGLVTVWRLLRAPRTALDQLTRRSNRSAPRDISPSAAQVKAIRNLTPRIGMLRDEVFTRYGLPRSIWAKPDTGELIWDYSQFGLTMVFNHDDMLTRWKLNGPNPRSSQEAVAEPARASQSAEAELPAVDLTERL